MTTTTIIKATVIVIMVVVVKRTRFGNGVCNIDLTEAAAKRSTFSWSGQVIPGLSGWWVMVSVQVHTFHLPMLLEPVHSMFWVVALSHNYWCLVQPIEHCKMQHFIIGNTCLANRCIQAQKSSADWSSCLLWNKSSASLYFSKADLSTGFHHAELDYKSSLLTSFQTYCGRYLTHLVTHLVWPHGGPISMRPRALRIIQNP